MKDAIDTLKEQLSELLSSGNQEDIEIFFTNKLSNFIPSCCNIDEEYIFLLNEAGSYYRGISNYQKSISCFTMLSNEMLRFGLNETPAYATLLNNMAGSFRMNGQFDIAEKLFIQSIDLFKRLEDTHSFAYASVLNNISLCYRAMGHNDTALKYQRLAILTIKENENPDYVCLATSYSNMANIMIALGMSEEAKAAADHSIRLFHAAKAMDDPAYIGALHTLGFLDYQSGDYKNAESNYRKAMYATEQRFGKNADYITSEKNLAFTLRKSGRLSEAIQLLENAASLENAAFGDEHYRYIQTVNAIKKMREEINE